MNFEVSDTERGAKELTYQNLVSQLHSLLEGERDFVANAANFSALLYHGLPDLNWAGFYFHKGGELVLGPFQGKPACIRIPFGSGVCGTAAQRRQTILVDNVHDFPGHIACDNASNSEIVVPLMHNGRLVGVLDLDSPMLARFEDADARGLNELVEILLTASEVPKQLF
jgi:L-methionine (R)-S-oxide reductase